MGKNKPYRPRLTKEEYSLIKHFREHQEQYDIKTIVDQADKIKAPKVSLPKILIFDIETSPLTAFVWQTQVWKAMVGADKVISQWFMLTWSAKWLFDDNTMSDKLTKEEALAEDDGRITKSLWKLFNEADIVVAHNGDRFDVPNINTRFLVNGLAPSTPYQSIDTTKVARKQFGFTHNSLNGLAKVFGFDQKIDTDFDLWKGCLNGDEKALAYMEKYNRYDVELLEEVYLKLRPWIKSHPNVALYGEMDEMRCPNCGSTHLKQEGHYFTMVGKYETYRCECGAFSRSRKTALAKDQRENLLASIAR